DGERERLDIVEHGESVALGGQDQAMQLENVDGDLVGEMVHDITHVHLDSRRFAPLPLREFGQTRTSCGDACHHDEEQCNEGDAIHGYPLECLFEKSQVPYTAKMMPHGSRRGTATSRWRPQTPCL